MLLVLICHLFVTKPRLRFGHTMRSPMSVPFVNSPVDLDACLDAAESLGKGVEIDAPNISAFPAEEQHILTFANISKLQGKAFPPMGEVFTLMDACLKENAASF